MRLYEEINGAFAEARCAFFPNGGGYFQGVKGLVSFSEEEIVLLLKKVKVCVKGNAMSVKKYCDGDLEITGKIYGVAILGSQTEVFEKNERKKLK